LSVALLFRICRSLVAGHVEIKEAATLALCREAKEEAGIEIQPENLKVVHVMHRLSDRENLDIFMHCNKWQGVIENLEPEKCGGLEFFDKNNLPNNTIPYIIQAIKYSFEGKHYSEIGWNIIN
jgi:8-oxo-dGTP pyrophosphatase MutT (NUDIX family)